MNLKELPKDLEDIVLKYYYQIEHYSKFKNVLEQIKGIEYSYNSFDNCMSYKIVNGNNIKSFHIKFCKICGKYYRSNIIDYRQDYRRSYRYSHYNTFMNENNNILTSDYIVSYGGDTLYWTNYYRNRAFNKHISCSCLRDLLDGMLMLL